MKFIRVGISTPIILIILFVFSSAVTSFAQFIKLGPDSKVSLITVAPGKDLDSQFGHSVLWISDPIQELDKAYNFGTFSSGNGNFYIEFLKSTLVYSLSVSPLSFQISQYESQNRSIKEEVLNLSLGQKQRLYNALETNYLPQNRYYQYKYFFDNCSTRIATILNQVCGDSLNFTGYTLKKLSFRQWIDLYAHKQHPWADFGMDLAIGAPSDNIATPKQAIFLPDNLSIAFRNSKIKIGKRILPLVASERDIFVASTFTDKEGLTPLKVFWSLAILAMMLTYWQLKKKRKSFTFDKILFSVCGIIGWLIIFLWFYTNHEVTEFNYDILWAFPLWIPLIWFVSPNKRSGWFSFLLIFYGFLLLCATGNIWKHNYVVIPILLILIIRVCYMKYSISKSYDNVH